jgi:hypothetical protein
VLILAHICVDEELGAGQLSGFIPLQASVDAAGRFSPDLATSGGPRMIATPTYALLFDRSRIIVVSSMIYKLTIHESCNVLLII